jgi:hypothetical protein
MNPTHKTPEAIWLIYVFSTEGSWAQNLERPAIDAPDTCQYWITADKARDVRTFAIDKDVRLITLDIKGRLTLSAAEETFKKIAQDTYGEIIKESHRFEVRDGTTLPDLERLVASVGLNPKVDWTALNFPMWIPEDAEYYSRSENYE